MPDVTDSPPAHVAADLEALSAALDDAIPRKVLDRNVLFATWNIQAFASLTRKWTAGDDDSPKRDLRGLRAITEIVSRFDVVAIQEVKGDLRALRDMMHLLGHDWSFLMTDVNVQEGGNDERMAYVFDRRRIETSGLAGELVVPERWLEDVAPDAGWRQFVRTPYAVSYLSGDSTFILVTLHVDYGQPDDRVPELRAIAEFMRDWAERTNRSGHNLIALGDFNINRRGDDLWEAFTSTGLHVPDDLNVPKTIFADPGEPEKDKFYDQVAWFETGGGRQRINVSFVRGGNFDFLPHVYTELDLPNSQLQWRISNHYPLWCEFAL